MADLLKQLLNKQNVAVDYIKQILAAFSEDYSVRISGQDSISEKILKLKRTGT